MSASQEVSRAIGTHEANLRPLNEVDRDSPSDSVAQGPRHDAPQGSGAAEAQRSVPRGRKTKEVTYQWRVDHPEQDLRNQMKSLKRKQDEIDALEENVRGRFKAQKGQGEAEIQRELAKARAKKHRELEKFRLNVSVARERVDSKSRIDGRSSGPVRELDEPALDKYADRSPGSSNSQPQVATASPKNHPIVRARRHSDHLPGHFFINHLTADDYMELAKQALTSKKRREQQASPGSAAMEQSSPTSTGSALSTLFPEREQSPHWPSRAFDDLLTLEDLLAPGRVNHTYTTQMLEKASICRASQDWFSAGRMESYAVAWENKSSEERESLMASWTPKETRWRDEFCI